MNEKATLPEVLTAFSLGMNASTPRQLEGTAPFLILPEASKLQSLEELLSKPLRVKAKPVFHELESFTRYVTEHKSDATRIFAHISEFGACFKAVLDFHEKDKPSWNSHTSEYPCPSSMEWKKWVEKNGQWMRQQEFAAFIEDRVTDIIEPSGATMLEMANEFHATTSVNFSSVIRLDNGNRQVNYQEETEAKAGQKGKLVIPEKFMIKIPVFRNGIRYEMAARFRYRVNEGKLAITYEIIDIEKIMLNAAREVMESIGKETEIQVFVGAI